MDAEPEALNTPASGLVFVLSGPSGVGKSTLVLAVAETLSAYHGKNVLVIDSDAQATCSSMLMTIANLHKLQQNGLTLVDYLVARVLQKAASEWPRFVVRNVSDVDDARTVFLVARGASPGRWLHRRRGRAIPAERPYAGRWHEIRRARRFRSAVTHEGQA